MGFTVATQRAPEGWRGVRRVQLVGRLDGLAVRRAAAEARRALGRGGGEPKPRVVGAGPMDQQTAPHSA